MSHFITKALIASLFTFSTLCSAEIDEKKGAEDAEQKETAEMEKSGKQEVKRRWDKSARPKTPRARRVMPGQKRISTIEEKISALEEELDEDYDEELSDNSEIPGG